MGIIVTEKAANAVKRIIIDQQQSSLTPELRDVYQALSAELGRGPYLSELAAKLGTTEEQLKEKLGPAWVAFGKVHLRMRVVGGGCSGFTNKLDLDPDYNEKTDELFDFFGVPVVVDRRSLMYLEGAQVDYHDELNRPGFSVSNPQAKSTCGCGSSYSM
jgi:iron-sulfur cluster assembly accessory protein